MSTRQTYILIILACVPLCLAPTFVVAVQITPGEGVYQKTKAAQRELQDRLVIGNRVLVAEETKPLILDAGHITLQVHISRTATLFHVVDQLSAWDEATHAQYRRYFKRVHGTYSERDQELLAKHAAVRRSRGWGGGLEQTFYTPHDLESAIKVGIEQGYLTSEQATVEQEVIAHFATRIEEIIRNELPIVLAFRQRLIKELDQLRSFSGQISRFCHGVRPTVPVYLIVNPADRDVGGGFDGGRLKVEIPRAYDAMPTFLHELMHAFMSTQRQRVENTAKDVEDLSRGILEEGICYALSPGIIHAEPAGSDPLLRSVVDDVMAGKTLRDGGYPRDRRYGLALRPLLRQALQDETQTLESFLPRAVDVWLVIRQMDPTLRKVLHKSSPEQMSDLSYLTINKAYWFHSKERPTWISENEVKQGKDGHILIHIEERPDDDLQTYKRFYDAVDKTFMLKAESHPDVEAEAERGYWGQEFYLRVRQEEYEKMVRNIPYALQPLNQFLQYQWKVKQGVTITKNE